MNEHNWNIGRLIALILTLLLFVGHYFIPSKQLRILPSERFDTELYGYVHPTRGTSESWINKQENSMQCNYQKDNKYGCGFVVFKKDEFWQGLNLKPYENILLDINYEGPSRIIRIYLRNYNEAYSTKDDGDSTKFLSMILDVKEIGERPAEISLLEFTVAEWWINQKRIRRQSAYYEINNVVNFGVDFVEPGVHKLRVNSILLEGDYIKTKTLLFYILFFWMGVFVLEGIVRFYLLYRKYQSEKSLIHSLKDNQLYLEEEREKLRILSSTDPLTGVCNRTGMTQYIEKLFSDSRIFEKIGILLFDIDHFKKINDTLGHDIGDKVLKSFTQTILLNLRKEDIFARWGGEEFILVASNTNPKKLMHLAEKLRLIIEKKSHSSSLEIYITISIGATTTKEGETFDEAFKRADDALYKAKTQGRNCCIYEEV